VIERRKTAVEMLVDCVVQVVCADDIKAFFAGMEARKKARLEGLQYHCK